MQEPEDIQALLEHGHLSIHEGRISNFVEPFAGLLRMQYDRIARGMQVDTQRRWTPNRPERDQMLSCCIGRRPEMKRRPCS